MESKELILKDLQEKVSIMREKYNLGNDLNVAYIDLVSELGELGKELLKGTDYGTKDFDKTENLESEIGDVFYSLITISNILNIDMEKALEDVLKKYEKRFSEKGDIGSGN